MVCRNKENNTEFRQVFFELSLVLQQFTGPHEIKFKNILKKEHTFNDEAKISGNKSQFGDFIHKQISHVCPNEYKNSLAHLFCDHPQITVQLVSFTVVNRFPYD